MTSLVATSYYPDPTIHSFDLSNGEGEQDGTNWYIYCSNNPLNMIDPTGLWGSDVHYDRTKTWAGSAGFSDKQSEKIAKANEATDKGSTGPMPWQDQSKHFNTGNAESGTLGDTRIIESENHLSKAIEYQSKANDIRSTMGGGGFFNTTTDFFKEKLAMRNENKALKELGTGLHSLQDVHAHKDEYVSVSPTLGIYSHADPSNPINEGPNIADDPTVGRDRIENTESATKDYMNRFQEATK